MKKVIALALMLVMVASSPGFCIMDEVDRLVVKDRVASDIRPERDAGRLIGYTKDNLFKGVDMLLKPVAPVTDPIRKFTGEALKFPVKIVNTTWDFITKPIPGYKA